MVNKLQNYRTFRNLKQADVAKKAGMSLSHYNNIERGVKEANIKIKKKLAKVLDTSVSFLFPVDQNE